jgi:hypothetical protein
VYNAPEKNPRGFRKKCGKIFMKFSSAENEIVLKTVTKIPSAKIPRSARIVLKFPSDKKKKIRTKIPSAEIFKIVVNEKIFSGVKIPFPLKTKIENRMSAKIFKSGGSP